MFTQEHPQLYAKRLIKALGPDVALKVAVRAFEATRHDEGIDASKEAKDPRQAKKRDQAFRRLSAFWDEVFGLVLKQARPNLPRKAFLLK